MNRKRSLGGKNADQPSKQIRTEARGDASSTQPVSVDVLLMPFSVPFSAPFIGDDEKDTSAEWGKVLLLQRNQLSVLTKERVEKISTLERQVAHLQDDLSRADGDCKSAILYLTSVQEDLTLTLARLGAEGEDIEVDETTSAVAEAILQADGFSSIRDESLSAKSDAVNRLLAQIVELIEDRLDSSLKNGDETARKSSDELHARLKRSNDLLIKRAGAETELHDKIASLEEQLEDSKAELSRRRNQITKLQSAIAFGEKSEPEGKEESTPQTPKASPINPDTSNADQVHEFKAKIELLEEQLAQGLDARKKLGEELERNNQARDTPSVQSVLGSALYQTMEANLQELVLKEQRWDQERRSILSKRDAIVAQYEDSLRCERHNYKRRLEVLERQLGEATKSAEQAKASRDKISLHYEWRKLDSSTDEKRNLLQSQVDDLQKANRKLESKKTDLVQDMNALRERIETVENKLASGIKVSEGDEISRLRNDLRTEKQNSDSLYDEMESLSTELSNLENENLELEKKYADSMEALKKVQKERLGYRQQVISIREESKTIQVRLKSEEEQNKSLKALLTASKQLSEEAQKVAQKCQEEVSLLEQRAETLSAASEKAERKTRQAQAETEELKKAKNAAQSRALSVVTELEEGRFNTKKAEEQVAMLRRRLSKKEGQAEEDNSGVEFSKDELLREYRKIRNCSVKTDRPKEVVLLRCGHLFSRQCVDDLAAKRNRKCPICGKNFSNDEVRPIYFS
eukprot:CAMPEP_0184746064 /NCGR_PEP_ID=MMETSP0315-20130426/8631_1 /TAXON_ID=101924 /ORGANISM="Rhodosorus marinus, Strain UTEX LB 2760" /LENGTH=747 /DNA_ID=CAMNT_0027218447 /DNA_START=229 /DNA_END=2472 /DNA_ORIENTATION=+